MNILIQGNIETQVGLKFKKVFHEVLIQEIEANLAIELQSRLIPQLNQLFAHSRGYIEIFPKIMFDCSIQGNPIVEKHYVGLGLTGLFSLKNHSDFLNTDLERGHKNNSLLHPLTP